MLAGAGLGDDAPLAHALREQRLAERVVDLVRAGVREVLALEEDARAAERLAEPAAPRRAASGGRRSRRSSCRSSRENVVVLSRGEVRALELLDRRDQRLGHEAAAVRAEVAARVRIAFGERW